MLPRVAASQPDADRDGSKWRAVVARDARVDGLFVYAVRSTGIYCRPSCVSRRPRPEHVVFFSSPINAEDAGFRACKRCHPRAAAPADPWIEKVSRACDHLARAGRVVTLADLTARVGGSSYHLHRNFKRLVGLTPREYAEGCRLARVKQRMRGGDRVTTALFSAGYGSSRGFYEGAAPKLGMLPSTYRAGGTHMHIQYAIVDSALGRLLVAATDRGVCSVAMAASDEELKRNLRREYPAATIASASASLGPWVREILERLEGRKPRKDLPLDVRATAFQWQVWRALAEIPRGDTRTYSEVATAIGRPHAARAVGRACATNPVAVAIPCHRVVAISGALTGYRWGMARKKALLASERSPQ
jgi:AraC family transcriptional regulator of adaptative response/methylated-DNA-[protein]-cysteine methyltransferase